MLKIFLILVLLICENFLFPLEDNNQKKLQQREKRSNGKVDDRYRWPNSTVPFRINTTFITPEHAKPIYEAMKIIESATCVRFKNYTNESDFITISGHTNQCKSNIGRQRGEQILKLAKGGGCFNIPKILHELVHVLGFQHLHRGMDRDKHIKIIWENVKPDKMYKFEIKGEPGKLSDYGIEYDYDSIMHKKPTVYSKNGKNTIETLNPEMMSRIGQRKGLSTGDIAKINKMYKC